ncbi:PucR family transcriptional regulator [Nocardiopsis sp. N85]|uniref:PucR family transcriptional regulator n=1 Tax=Nocardiopsis sp. N85 TaxID=3029400 RepID=UPI00237FB331|nr:PucR family transcriptional regulator [Nocardiopsis sp. N85]MDE3720936.1 PucR family transcriptional regulator [Nocardiopsis sp. N85]
MPPTLGGLVRTPSLGLRPLTGDEGLDRRVEWVAVSELTDPTPYLAGGELLLTTGVRWVDSPPDLRAYVRRLARRDIAGLGFGVGVALERTPDELREAAAEFGVVLLEVERATPFIAVGKEVSRLLAKEEYEGLSRAFTAQRDLTRAALSGAGAIVDRLARDLGARVLLLSADGSLDHAAPVGADRHPTDLTEGLDRLKTAGPRASMAITVGDEHVWAQPLATGRRVRGFLVVGAGGRLGPEQRTLVNAAVSLLSLELERDAHGDIARLGEGVLIALLTGALDPTRPGAERLAAALPPAPVVVAVADEVGAPHPPHGILTAGHEGRALLLAGADTPVPTITDLLDGPIGVSDPVDHTGLPVALAQAERAREAARAQGGGAVRAAELPGGLLGLTDTPAGVGLAEDLLAPLLAERSHGELIASLRAYLAASGRWDAAADALGVHRHTLRYRMRRIRDLLPVDLDDPDARAELWIALRLHAAHG